MVDVDGVLNVAASSKERSRLCYREGWRQKRVELPVGTFRLFWNPAVVPQLCRLARETGAELAWGTTWEDYANLVVGPLLGLPALAVAPVRDFAHKADGLVPWTSRGDRSCGSMTSRTPQRSLRGWRAVSRTSWSRSMSLSG